MQMYEVFLDKAMQYSTANKLLTQGQNTQAGQKETTGNLD